MKTTMKILLSAAGFVFASQASAVTEMAASAVVNPTQCVLLSNDIQVQLSAKTGAAYDCSTTQVFIGAVSSAGQTKSRTLPCQIVSNATATTPTKYTGTCTTNTGGATYVVKGPTVYTAGSLGGQVSGDAVEGASATTPADAAKAAGTYLKSKYSL